MVKKNPIAITRLICILIYICLILVYNFRKIIKAKRIFVNSWGFGHSITDTSAYLNHYHGKGIVISLGTSFGQIPGTERNNFFNFLQPHKLIISLNIPSAFVTKIAENHYQSPHTIQFFFKQPELKVEILKSKLNPSLADFHKKNLENKKYVCLTIRRGDAPYHSNANYYQDVIRLLHLNGFGVYLLGDKQYFINLTEQEKFSYSKIVINCKINKEDSKLLDLLAISNCAFVVGDQGGAWSLVHAFNKPGLIINSSCVAHLQYNVECLPRKWIYEYNKSEVNDANILFKELYFRYKPFYLTHRRLKVIQVENELDLILRVTERYINKFEYLVERKMQKKLTNYFSSNNQLKLAGGSCYSDEYIEKLVFG